MTTPTGTIGMSDVNVELGKSSTAQISLNDADVRALAGIPSGTISMNDLRGKTFPIQPTGVKDSTFSGSIDNGVIFPAINFNSSGKIFIGGSFTTYSGVTVNRFAALNTDGSIDTSFSTGTAFNSTVNVIAVQSDDKVLLGGTFTSYNGTASNRIIRLNTNGTVDTSFNVGTGFNTSNVLDLAIQSDGKIIAVGGFTTYNGTTINYIARLNTNGSLDTGFSTGTGFNSSTSRVAIQSDGKIVVVGGFTSYNGTARNRIVRLNTDGTIDTSYNVGTGFDTIPSGGMRIQSDDKAVVCGGFTFYNGTSAIGIIRLNTDGTRDTSFNIGTGFNSLAVNKVGIQYDGKIVATGNYTSYNGTAVNRLIRLNTDGTIDTSLNIGTGFDGSTNGIGIVSNVNFQTNGRYVVIGGFANYNGVTTTRIIRITN